MRKKSEFNMFRAKFDTQDISLFSVILCGEENG